MFHRHPLENPSLAPFGLATSYYQRRLKYESNDPYWVNYELVIAKFWDRCNRALAKEPRPVCTIIHEILPGMAQANRLTKGDFIFVDGMPYLTRDIVVLSTLMQWFGTQVGRVFLEDPSCSAALHPEREFVEKLAAWPYHRDLPARLLHACNASCRHDSREMDPCRYRFTDASARDRAVIDGLMRWLGRKAGRQFVADYQARRGRVVMSARERWRNRELKPRLIA